MDREIQQIVEKHKIPCVVGFTSPSKQCPIGCSKKGGFPDVGDGFAWPSHQKRYLSFLAQIDARHFLGNDALGTLQFFWNEGNCGGSMKDDGAFRVLHATHPMTRLEVAPESEYRSMGIFTRTHSPTVWKEEALDFRESYCLPPMERLNHLGYDWGCDRDDLYFREMESVGGFFRIGGPPNPVQSDDMEKACARIRNIGPQESWRLLLEVDSQSDMMWGDAGKLYWFIHQEDLENHDFSRVWMQMQCH